MSLSPRFGVVKTKYTLICILNTSSLWKIMVNAVNFFVISASNIIDMFLSFNPEIYPETQTNPIVTEIAAIFMRNMDIC